MRLTSSIGMILLSIYLILTGLGAFIPAIAGLGTVMAILALVAGRDGVESGTRKARTPDGRAADVSCPRAPLRTAVYRVRRRLTSDPLPQTVGFQTR